MKKGGSISTRPQPFVRGEQSLYFNAKDKGLVCVTGCCHQNMLAFADFAQQNILGGENLYGLYGGLHIVPFGPLSPEAELLVKGMYKYNFKKVACNHCSGEPTVRRAGVSDRQRHGQYGSKSDIYVGNGDEVVFG